MRIYKDFLGDEWDLDNPETYKGYPTDIEELRNRFFREIGYALWYVNYLQEGFEGYKIQLINIDKILQKFTEGERIHRFDPTEENIRWHQEMVYLLEDENG